MNDRKYTTAAEREQERDEMLRSIRHDLDLLLLSLNMKCPDHGPVEVDPWDNDFEEVATE